MSYKIDLKELEFSHIGRETKLEGNFTFNGPTIVSGTIIGTVEMGNCPVFIIERDGLIKGKLKCHHIEIRGEFEGEIFSAGKVIIHPSSRVKGQVYAKDLIIRPGAIIDFSGHSEGANLI
ncbi:MAG: polymer-forming cytoskeletal protein [Halobacteriovoraceae bacterium]|nr:polymer-forming cytoskeletal protein [Halobacteriovoraceae bacterium]